MKRRSVLLSVAVLLFAASHLVPAADFSFAACAPEETLLYAEVADHSDLSRTWEKTPYARVWNDPEFAPFWKPMRERWDEFFRTAQEKQGITTDELGRLFPGRVCAFMSDLRYEFDEAKLTVYKEKNTGWIARIAPGSEDRVRRLIEDTVLGRLPGNAERSVQEFRGVRIYTSVFLESQTEPPKEDPDGRVQRPGPDQPTERDTTESGISVPPMGTAEYHYEYAFVDDVCFLLEGQRAFMKKVLANYFSARDGAPAETSLAGTPNYRKFLENAGAKSQITAYANIQRLLEQVSVGPVWKKISSIQALGLGELRSAGATLSLGESAADLLFTLNSTPHPQGVASLAIGEFHNEFASLKLTPEDAWSWSSSPLDTAGMFNLIKRATFQWNPAAWQTVSGMLAQIAQQTGTDFERDIIGALGQEFASYSRPPADALTRLSQPGMTDVSQPRQVMFFGLKRADGFAPKLAKFLEATLTMAMSGSKVTFQTEEFQSAVIYRLDLPTPAGVAGGADPMTTPQPSFCFSVTPSWLLMSADPSELRATLRRAAGQNGATLESRDAFREAMKNLKPGAVARGWQDSAKLVEQIASGIQANPVGLALLGDIVNATAMPDPEAFARHFGHMVMGAYTKADTYRLEVRMLYPAR